MNRITTKKENNITTKTENLMTAPGRSRQQEMKTMNTRRNDDEEVKQWLATRKEAGAKIDPATAEIE
jgi:hypothetical protein